MELAGLVAVVARVRATPKKTDKTALLAGLLRQARGREAVLAAEYLSGGLPHGRIGIGWSLIQAAMVEGPPAGPALTLEEVDRSFEALAADQGAGSIERRTGALRRLFGRAGAEERRFLAQLLLGEVRQGALEGLVLDAVALAAGLPVADVRRAMMYAGRIGEIAGAALEEGQAGLARFSLRLLSPVSPMLANSAQDAADALARLGEAAFEFKLDGARIQVHKRGEEIRIFTRQLQDVTDRLPDVAALARALPVQDALLDGEAIALRPDGRPFPFQVTMRRLGRVKDVDALRREVPLSCFFFDCLYLDGQGPVVTKPYRRRRELLGRIVPEASLMPQIVTDRREEAEAFLARSLQAGHEGLMAKSLDAPYMAGQRGSYWLKLKAAVTLDLVVLAAEWGHGRRAGRLSNLHLGARDPETGQFVMLGKTFKGLTDRMLEEQTARLLALETRRDDWTVYVKPELVVEIAFGGIQASPRYPAGLALRFARVKGYRPDKPAAEADTIQTVRELHRRQHASG